ncbi:MAG: hypothetical protein EXS35_17995 [Pedosphaera sp.]|nr:hypothetical protein [Pedosphaera sp.]
MKHGGKIILCLAGGLMLHAQARALTSESSGNPYANIVDRNVFGLKPAPIAEPPKPPEVAAPPITLQGIISAFGKKQVLFKTMMSAKPGEVAKETSLVMAEGERLGEITVLEINEAAGTVKFDNHGKPQIKDITKDGVKQGTGGGGIPGGQPGGVPGGVPAAGIPSPLSGGGGSSVTTFGGNPGNLTIPGRPLRLNPSAASTVNSQSERPLTADEQTVLIELNRKIYERDFKSGKMPPLPPTELTPKSQ